MPWRSWPARYSREWILRDVTGERSHVTLTPLGERTRIQDKKAWKLMERLEDLVTGTGTEEASALSPPLPEGRIDASLLTADVEASHPASVGRRLRAGGG